MNTVIELPGFEESFPALGTALLDWALLVTHLLLWVLRGIVLSDILMAGAVVVACISVHGDCIDPATKLHA